MADYTPCQSKSFRGGLTLLEDPAEMGQKARAQKDNRNATCW